MNTVVFQYSSVKNFTLQETTWHFVGLTITVGRYEWWDQGCSGCGNRSFANAMEMNGSIKWPFKAHSDYQKSKFLPVMDFVGKFGILYLGHQFKKKKNHQ